MIYTKHNSLTFKLSYKRQSLIVFVLSDPVIIIHALLIQSSLPNVKEQMAKT